MKPILKYPGAKWRIAPQIVDMLPEHETYVEPYFGSGAVFFNKKAARIETLNDLDGNVVHFFKTCREQGDALADAIAMTPWARDEFMNAKLDPKITDDIERARQFAVNCWMSFGCRMEGTKSFRHSTGAKENGGPDNPKLWARLPAVIREAANRLLQAQIENLPALDIVQSHNGPKVLIYADPPYVISTRTAHHNQYIHEMTDTDHLQLLTALKAHTGPVVLSGYDCEMYRDLLTGWTDYHISTQAERGSPRVEFLWLNPMAAEKTEQMSLQGMH